MTQRILVIGVDTGGTYTDAIVYEESTERVLGKAKALTTHDDLAIGIDEALGLAISAASVTADEIRLVSMSTTLATNALVENKGRSACLVTIGFEAEALDRAGLREALGSDSVIVLAGGHTSHGTEIEPIDTEALRAEVSAVADHVDAFAVTAQFSVRNPSHELIARDVISEITGKPVTCSHYLSANLNGPKRAVTALLNARLIAMVDELVTTTLSILRSRSISAPLMVVRGDGSLVSSEFVLQRPIETILSGPAASLIGAGHLVGLPNAVVSDIGGTTTDIAVLSDGEPEIGGDGAVVGGHRTMVEAVTMFTHGLGGDSQVRLAPRADGPELLLGPRRVIPLSQLALDHGDAIAEMLQRQLTAEVPTDLDGVMVSAVALGDRRPRLTDHERTLLDEIADQTLAADALLSSGLRRRALDRLIARGLIRSTGFTPTDASHVLGTQTTYDTDIAVMAASLFARQRDRYGIPIATTAQEVSQAVVDTLVRSSAEALLAATMARDGLDSGLVQSTLVAAALDRTAKTTRIDVGLSVPIVALGAPSGTYYGAVGDLLGSVVSVPEHADVANAVGAAVGRIRITHRVVISAPRRGLFRVHTASEPLTFADLDEARSAALDALSRRIDAEMHEAGAGDFDMTDKWDETSVSVGGRELFVEGVITASASGRPDVS